MGILICHTGFFEDLNSLLVVLQNTGKWILTRKYLQQKLCIVWLLSILNLMSSKWNKSNKKAHLTWVFSDHFIYWGFWWYCYRPYQLLTALIADPVGQGMSWILPFLSTFTQTCSPPSVQHCSPGHLPSCNFLGKLKRWLL